MNRAAVGAALHYCCVSWDVHFARRHPIPGSETGKQHNYFAAAGKGQAGRQAPGWTGGITTHQSSIKGSKGYATGGPRSGSLARPPACHRQTREQMKCLELHPNQAHLIRLSEAELALYSRALNRSTCCSCLPDTGSGCQQSPGLGAAGLASEPAQSFEFQH